MRNLVVRADRRMPLRLLRLKAVRGCESSGGRCRQVGVDDGEDLPFVESVAEAPRQAGQRLGRGSPGLAFLARVRLWSVERDVMRRTGPRKNVPRRSGRD